MDGNAYIRQTAIAIADYVTQELDVRPDRDYRFCALQDGPRVFTLVIRINPRYARGIIGMAEPLSMAARLDKGASIRIGRGRRGTLALEVPKPKTLWFNIGVANLPRQRGLLAYAGLDNDRRPARVNFADPLTPHTLVAGATGCGKTNVVRVLVYNLAMGNEPDKARFVLIDTKKKGKCWSDFAHLPHLAHPVITDDCTALRALSWACAEIDRRSGNGQGNPHVFVGIDEAQDLLDRPEFVKAIGDIAATGREFGIHLLAACQNPTADQLGDASIKRNLTTRLVGRVDSPTAAYVCTGQKGSGAETLCGAGDMLLVDPSGTMRLTAAFLTGKDIDRLPRIESVSILDLGEYEDVDHVLDQADNKSGRPSEPLEMKHLALALKIPDISQRELYRQFSIGFARAKRVLESAAELRAELHAIGCRVICEGCNETLQRNELTSF